MSALGQKRTFDDSGHVRFTPESGHWRVWIRSGVEGSENALTKKMAAPRTKALPVASII